MDIVGRKLVLVTIGTKRVKSINQSKILLASEEFLWKIFPGEDFQPLSESSVVMLAFVCHLHKKIARDSLPVIE